MLNRCEFIGNLGSDPEVRYMPSGDQITTISIATTRRWKNNEGQRQEQTEWIRCVAFKKLAEIMSEYLHKGSKVYVAGRFHTNKYEDNAGVTKYSTDIVLAEMIMLDSAGGNQDQGGGQQQNQQQQRPQQQQQRPQQQQQRPQQQQQRPQQNQQNQNQGGNQGYDNEYDDDIPF
ncbi:MAG: single-stranded DNA-binding protein [Candidatus Scalindua sp.]|nr:single-stranded DNA-binding protein [Candidatus Scalindua sp.]